ncbi:MAG: hypothetical protein ACYDCQ_08525 [Dehalococcoidia bacterium]
MQVNDMRPFLGRCCALTIRCRACGREHDRRGRLASGPHGGDVSLGGVVYSVEDIISISPEAGEPVSTLAVALTAILPYATLAALLAAWLQLARR